mgnify:CR=1 FL=1
MSFFPPDIQSKTDKITYLETCWNAGAGKVGQIRGIVGELMLGGLVLDRMGVERIGPLIVLIGVIYILGVFLFGVRMEKSKFLYRQQDVINRKTNPPSVRIEKNTERILEKLNEKP